MKAQLEASRAELAETAHKLSSAREEAQAAAKTARELAEARRSLKAEQEKAQGLRAKLVEAQRARVGAEEAREAAEQAAQGGASGRPPPPQLELANRELEGLLRSARAESRSLREELMSKGSLLVDMGSQLSNALEAAAVAEQRLGTAEADARSGREVATLLQQTEGERNELATSLAQREADLAAANEASAQLHRALEEQRQQAAYEAQLSQRGADRGSSREAEAVAAAVAAENATLRAENAAMTAELSALSPQFFEELEDLKYAYATARQHLDRYERRFGPPPPE